MGKNACIECSVQQCAYHAVDENYCTLNKIKVGTHENCPTQVECTDCESFKLKQGWICKKRMIDRSEG